MTKTWDEQAADAATDLVTDAVVEAAGALDAESRRILLRSLVSAAYRTGALAGFDRAGEIQREVYAK